MTTSVLVVDDQPLFCSGMRLLIDAQPDLTCAGAAHTGRAAIARSAALRPDVVLMDLRMPDGNGITATRTITGQQHPPRVLVLTTFRDHASVQTALSAGAHGFITKDATPDRLIAAIRETAAGLRVRAGSAGGAMLSDPAPTRQADVAAIESLTPREQEVFLHAARGLSNPDIAALTRISDNTVRTHIGAILTELGLANRHQLIAYAYRHALLQA